MTTVDELLDDPWLEELRKLKKVRNLDPRPTTGDAWLDSLRDKRLDQGEYDSRPATVSPEVSLQQEEPIGLGGQLASAGGAVVRGGVSVLASLPKAVAGTYGALQGLTKSPDEDLREYALWRLGDWAEKTANEWLPADPRVKDSFLLEVLPQGAGSMGAFMAGGAAGQALRVPTAAVALLGATSQGTQSYEEAKQYGATEEDARLAAAIGGAFGLTEVASEPLIALKTLRRLNDASGEVLIKELLDKSLAKAGGKIAASSAVEAGEEVVQQIGSNLAAKVYNDEQELVEGVVQAGAAGGILGGLVQGIAQAVRRVRINQLERIAGLGDNPSRKDFAAATGGNPDDVPGQEARRATVEDARKKLAEMQWKVGDDAEIHPGQESATYFPNAYDVEESADQPAQKQPWEMTRKEIGEKYKAQIKELQSKLDILRKPRRDNPLLPDTNASKYARAGLTRQIQNLKNARDMELYEHVDEVQRAINRGDNVPASVRLEYSQKVSKEGDYAPDADVDSEPAAEKPPHQGPPSVPPTNATAAGATAPAGELRPLDMRTTIKLAWELLGDYPAIKKLAAYTRGVFDWSDPNNPKIKIDPEVAKDPEKLAQVLRHELGHLADFLPDKTLKRGNLLGRIASRIGDFRDQLIAGIPGGPGPLTDAELAALHEQAKTLSTTTEEEVELHIEKTMGLTPKDILAIWNATSNVPVNKALEKHIAKLDTKQKKAIVAAALKGRIPEELKAFTQVLRQPTGVKFVVVGNKRVKVADIKAEYERLIKEEISKRQLLDENVVRAELIALSEWWRPYDKAKATPSFIRYRNSGKELYADAVSVFFSDPGALETRAPEFFRGFTNYLTTKPEVLENYLRIQAILAGSSEEQAEYHAKNIIKMFGATDKAYTASVVAKRAAEMSYREYAVQFFQQYILNRNAPVNQLGGKQLIPKAESAAAIVDELFNMDNPNHILLDRVNEGIWKPLQALGVTRDDIGQYLFLRRASVGDRQQFGNPLGYTPKEAHSQLLHLRQKLGGEKFAALENAMEVFYKANYEILARALKEGVISQELFDSTIEPNKDTYAHFAVTDYVTDVIPAAIKEQIGTFKEIGNPFDFTLMKMISINRLTELNRAKTAIRDALREHSSADIKPVEIPKIKGISWSVPTKKPAPGFDHIMVLEDGKPHWYEIPSNIAKATQTHDVGGLAKFMSPLRSAVYRIFHPLYVTWNPGFGQTNPLRDGRRTVQNMGTIGTKLYKDFKAELMARGMSEKDATKLAKKEKITVGQMLWGYWQSVPASLKRAKGISDETINKMFDERALSTPWVKLDSTLDEAIPFERMLAQHGLGDVKKSQNIAMRFIQRLLDGVEGANIFMETISKVAAYKVLETKNVGASERAYIVRKYAGTPDIMQRGLSTPITNTIWMYSKVRWNGLQADLGLATNPETAAGWWWRRAVWTFLPKLLTRAALIGYFGPSIAHMLSLIPSYFLANYDVIPLGTSGEGDEEKTIFLTIPQDDVGRFLGAITHYAMGLMNESEISDLTNEAVGAFMPSMNPILDIGGKWTEYASGINPMDAWAGRQIIPDSEWEAGGWHSTSKMLAWTIDKFGVLSVLAHPATGKTLGSPFSPGTETSMEITLKSSPLTNRLLRISDRGLSEEAWAAIQNEDQESARFRLGLPDEVRHLTRQRYALGRRGSEHLTEKQNLRRMQLNHWYSTSYLPITRAMKADPENAESLKQYLLESTQVFMQK